MRPEDGEEGGGHTGRGTGEEVGEIVEEVVEGSHDVAVDLSVDGAPGLRMERRGGSYLSAEGLAGGTTAVASGVDDSDLGVAEDIGGDGGVSEAGGEALGGGDDGVEGGTTTTNRRGEGGAYLPTRAELGSGTARMRVFLLMRPFFWRSSSSN